MYALEVVSYFLFYYILSLAFFIFALMMRRGEIFMACKNQKDIEKVHNKIIKTTQVLYVVSFVFILLVVTNLILLVVKVYVSIDFKIFQLTFILSYRTILVIANFYFLRMTERYIVQLNKVCLTHIWRARSIVIFTFFVIQIDHITKIFENIWLITNNNSDCPDWYNYLQVTREIIEHVIGQPV